MSDTSSSSPRLLVIDDDSELRSILYDLFTDEGYRVDLAASLDDALTLIGTRVYHLVLTDLLAQSAADPLRSALMILREARPMPVIAVTGWNITAAEITRAGLARLVPKPFDVVELVKIVAAQLPTLSHEQQGHAESARRFCAAFNAHDADGCMAVCVDDVRIEPPEQPLWSARGPIVGSAACRAHLNRGWTAVPGLRIEEYVVFPQAHQLALRCVKSWEDDVAHGERIVVSDTLTLRFTGERISGISVEMGNVRWESPMAEATIHLHGAQDQQG